MILDAQSAWNLPASGPDVIGTFIISGRHKNTCAMFAPSISGRATRAACILRPGLDRTRSERRQEIAQGEGFPGMDVVYDRPLSEPDDGRFRPGNQGTSVLEPEGFAWRLDPGNDLVLNATCGPPASRSRCGPPSVSTLPTRPGKLSNADQARGAGRHLTIFVFRWTRTCSPSILRGRHSRTFARRLRDAAQRPAQMADPHS